MPNPGGYQAYSITFENESDLPQIVEVIRQLRISMIIQNAATIRSLLMDAAVLGDKESYYPGVKRPLNESEMQGIQKKTGIGRWMFYGALYGPPPVRDALWGAIHASFSTIKGAKFYRHGEGEQAPGILHVRAKTMAGIPTYDELKWVDWVPNGAHFFFSPISEVRGEAATRQYEICKKRIIEAGFDVIVDFIVGMREVSKSQYRLTSRCTTSYAWYTTGQRQMSGLAHWHVSALSLTSAQRRDGESIALTLR